MLHNNEVLTIFNRISTYIQITAILNSYINIEKITIYDTSTII